MHQISGTQSDMFDFPDFAQEFLRRNPVYQNQYREMYRFNEAAAGQSRSSGVALNWGLEFLGSACTKRSPASRNLVARLYTFGRYF